MAERRMFTKTIIDSDAFLDMPLSTQALYFHLAMRADDDGFLNNAKKITRVIGANQNDYDLLLAKRFIIQFEDGICVIKHWRMHNYIQKDRYKPTVYQDKKQLLGMKKNKSYTLNKAFFTECIQDVYSLESQVRLGKDRLGKDKDKDKDNNLSSLLETIKSEMLKETLQDFIDHRKEMKKPLTERAFKMLLNKLDPFSDEIKIAALKEAIINNWQSAFPKKENTFIKQKKEIALPDWYDKYQKQLKEVANKEVEKLSDKEINEIMERMKEREVQNG